MSIFMRQGVRRVLRGAVTAAVVGCAVFVSGCANKAEALKLNAQQFSTQAISAIEVAQDNSLKEVAVAKLSQDQVEQRFASLALSEPGKVTGDTFAKMVSPFSVRPNPAEQTIHQHYESIKKTYQDFGSIFNDLPRGSVLAAKEVKRAVPIVNTLTADLVALAVNRFENPVTFQSQRASILAQINSVSLDKTLSPSEKAFRLKVLADESKRIIEAEDAATIKVMQTALMAAQSGKALSQMISQYDKISLDELLAGASQVIGMLGKIEGLDVSGLEDVLNTTVNELRQDPALKAALDSAMSSAHSLGE